MHEGNRKLRRRLVVIMDIPAVKSYSLASMSQLEWQAAITNAPKLEENDSTINGAAHAAQRGPPV